MTDIALPLPRPGRLSGGLLGGILGILLGLWAALSTVTSNVFSIQADQPQGRQYWVRPNGVNSASSNCTVDVPCRDANYVLSNYTVEGGDTIWFHPGNYTEKAGSSSLSYLSVYGKSGDPNNPINLKGYGPNRAAVIGGNYTTSDARYGFAFGDSSYWRIENFTFTGTDLSCIWTGNLESDKSGVGFEIVNNKFDHCGYAQKLCSHFNGHTAIFTSPMSAEIGSLIEGNEFANTGRDCANNPGDDPNTYRHDHDIYLNGRGHVVRNNIFYENYHGHGVKVDGGSSDSTMPTNPSTWTHIIVNNTFGKNNSEETHGENGRSGQPITIIRTGGKNKEMKYYIANNLYLRPISTWGSLANGGRNQAAVGYYWDEPDISAGYGPHVCAHNLSMDADGEDHTKYDCGSNFGTGGDHNIGYYNDVQRTNNLNGVNQGVTEATVKLLGDWETGFDFRIASDSLAVNYGIASVPSISYWGTSIPTDDYAGNPRVGAPDVGAFEAQ